jgi:flagellar basal body L-ring protein FlgH
MTATTTTIGTRPMFHDSRPRPVSDAITIASARTNRIIFQARGTRALKERGQELLDKVLAEARTRS